MIDSYLIAAMQVVTSSRSPRESALQREADAIKNALEIAAITGTFPQLGNIPHYSETPELQERQSSYEQNMDALVGQVIRGNRELLESESRLILGGMA